MTTGTNGIKAAATPPCGYLSALLLKNNDWLPDGRVLDIATGVGRKAIYLARQGHEFETVDFSNGVLTVARER